MFSRSSVRQTHTDSKQAPEPHPAPCSLSSGQMNAVGYRQVWKYLCGEYSRETMREKAVTATMQLAKRQMLWVKKMTRLSRFSVSGTAEHTADVLALICSANKH